MYRKKNIIVSRWMPTDIALPENPTTKEAENLDNEYLVSINGADSSTVLYYMGDGE